MYCEIYSLTPNILDVWSMCCVLRASSAHCTCPKRYETVTGRGRRCKNKA